MKRHLATLLATVAFAMLATATELPDPEGQAHDRPIVGSASGGDRAPQPLHVDELVRGALELDAPEDRYAVELTLGTTYTIDLRAAGWESHDPDRALDPSAPVLTATVLEGTADHPGGRILSDDRMLPGVYTRAHVTPRVSGPHTLSVRAEHVGPAGGAAAATYELRLFDRELPLCHPQDCFHVPALP